SLLPQILARVAPMPVDAARDGDALDAGHVYVAPPNLHLRVTSDLTIALDAEDRVHFVRPSADVLFESLASLVGPRLVAVVLSGMGLDGAEGARAVRDAGGAVIIQDPATAEFAGMPRAAAPAATRVADLGEIASAVVEAVTT